MFEVHLFGKDKGGKYKVWCIEVREYLDPVSQRDTVSLSIRHGQEGGKITLKQEFDPVGKQGRTSYEQAVLEAEARVKKQKDKGYRENKADLEVLPVLAMLSKDHTKDGKEDTINEGVFISDKLDGVRCLAKCILSEALGIKHVTLESRTGQPYNVPHIQEELLGIMEVGDVLDGELYVHGPSLQEITSAVKREDAEAKLDKALAALHKHEKTPVAKQDQAWSDKLGDLIEKVEDASNISAIRKDLQYHVFDLIVMDIPFSERIEMFKDYVNMRCWADQGGYVVPLTYQYVDNLEDMITQLHYCIARGYEGIMYRTKGGLYESGKRSTGLWKFKLFMDAEFLILDVEPAKDDGSVFVLQNDLTHLTFTCTLGDMEQRASYLRNKAVIIGEYLKVKFQSRYKKTLLPQFPTGIMLREGAVIDGQFVPYD